LDLKADGTYSLGSPKNPKNQLGGTWKADKDAITLTMKTMGAKPLAIAVDEDIKQFAPKLRSNPKALEDLRSGQIKALSKPMTGTISPDNKMLTFKESDTKTTTFSRS
jgi:hypothetical protein